jgi:hypothetical protein
MRVLAGLVGVVIGFLLGGLLIDALLPNKNWPDVVPFVLAITGWLAGTAVAGRLR